MSIKFTEESYKNFGKCIVMDNGVCTVKITVDVGPRIIYYALNGMENILKEDVNRDTVRDSAELHDFFGTEENWYIYGGHRLWTSPEAWPDSYTPDNSPVDYKIEGNTITLNPELRTKVGEQHIMTVTLSEDSSDVTIGHRVVNISDHELTLAPWCLTVMDKGGVEIIPQCRKKTGLLSNRRLVIWEYTDINDERCFMSNDFITLCQTDKAQSFKLGMNNEDGWGAYLIKGQLFCKCFDFDENAEYPDYGCNYETFTDPFIMEVETLGALKTLAPYESTTHEERWSLKKCSDSFNPRDNEEIRKFVEENILG
ncbi:MAG: hypothetical protein IJ416_03320 [Ruminiclostridium sp.]|nr:hypothetical protein [Ruminiclostridium sp.]